jgi:membrane protease YdiL (CAAX protease family)
MNVLKHPFTFFGLTFIYSWVLWLLAVIFGANLSNLPVLIFYYLGGIGPSLIGILLTYKNEDKDNIKEFWQRSYDPRLIKPKWYFLILIFVVFPLLIGIGIDLFIGGLGAEMEGIDELVSNPLSFFPYLLFLIIAVLAEEFGWRGYAQEHIQREDSMITSGLIIGIFWSIWHLPLFFIEGTYQYELGIGSFEFWLFFIVIIPDSLIYTWIYNNNSKSILSAIIYHLLGNLMGELFAPVGIAPFIRFITICAIAIILSLIYSKKLLENENL